MCFVMKTKLIFVQNKYHVEYTTFEFGKLSIGDKIIFNIKKPPVAKVQKFKSKIKMGFHSVMYDKPIVGEYEVVNKKVFHSSESGLIQYVKLKSV